MNKKEYISPKIEIEDLSVDADFALGCGSFVTSSTVACLATSSYDDFEILTEVWDIPPETSLDDPILMAILYSSSLTCRCSCYQGPLDSFYGS